MLIPAHFEVRFSMKLLKFHVKIKREFFLFFFEKKVFRKKKKVLFAFSVLKLLAVSKFFFLFVLSARARARARAPSCKHGGALGALPKNKSKFQPFRARGRVRGRVQISAKFGFY